MYIQMYVRGGGEGLESNLIFFKFDFEFSIKLTSFIPKKGNETQKCLAKITKSKNVHFLFYQL